MTAINKDIKGNSFAIRRKYCADNPVSIVRASGEDALEFLQGQFTQDLSKLEDRAVAYGFLLTQKGRVFGDAHLRRIGLEEWQIMSWSLSAPELMARLEAFIIADDVELEDVTAGWRGWRVGESADGPAWGDAGADDLAVLSMAADVGMPWRIVVAAPGVEPDWSEGWEAAPRDGFEAARIKDGWPLVPTDLGLDDFPQEGGRHLVGVSFTKGCYLGQEVMARLAATGRVRRGLAIVWGDGAAPAGELKLTQGDRTIGELRSRAKAADGRWIGMAMLQLAHFDAARPLVMLEGAALEFAGMVGSGLPSV